MKLAVLSESPADEHAIRILVDAILDRSCQPIDLDQFRVRGWPQVFQIFPVVYKHLYYHTDADALVVVADTDQSDIIDRGFSAGVPLARQFRLGVLRGVIERVRSEVRPIANRQPLKIAIGVAFPAIEAWYLCGSESTASERDWFRRYEAKESAAARIRTMKQIVYGTDIPSLPTEIERGKVAAQRLANNLALLEQHFPIGFGPFANDIRNW